MAPKKKGQDEEPQGLFRSRAPCEQAEAEVPPTPLAERVYERSLPLFDEEQVRAEPWNPRGGTGAKDEEPWRFVDGDFDRLALPEALLADVSGWKRAPGTAKSAPLEGESPRFVPGPGLEAFEELPASNRCLILDAEWQSGKSELLFDETKHVLVQQLLAGFAAVLDSPLLPERSLWKGIYPQDGEGRPLYNPEGRYIVKLFLEGAWRQVCVDDLVPVVKTGGMIHPHAPLVPVRLAPGKSPIWPAILTKALLKAHHGLCKEQRFDEIDAFACITGSFRQSRPLSFDALKAEMAEGAPFRPPVIQMCTHVEKAETKTISLHHGASTIFKNRAIGGALAAVDGGEKRDRRPKSMLQTAGKLVAMTVKKNRREAREAVVRFVVCETCDEPMQIRVKALHAKPVGWLREKAVVPPSEVTEESEEESEYEEDEDEEDDGSVRTPTPPPEEPPVEEEPLPPDYIEGGWWVLWDSQEFQQACPREYQVFHQPSSVLHTRISETPLPVGDWGQPTLRESVSPEMKILRIRAAEAGPVEEVRLGPDGQTRYTCAEWLALPLAKGEKQPRTEEQWLTFAYPPERLDDEGNPLPPPPVPKPLVDAQGNRLPYPTMLLYEPVFSDDPEPDEIALFDISPWFAAPGPRQAPQPGTLDALFAAKALLAGPQGGVTTLPLLADPCSPPEADAEAEKSPWPQQTPGTHCFALLEKGRASGSLSVLLDGRLCPTNSKVEVVPPQDLFPQLLTLEALAPAVDGFYLYCRAKLDLAWPGRGPARVDFWTTASDPAMMSTLTLNILPVGTEVLDAPATAEELGADGWAPRDPGPLHSPAAYDRPKLVRKSLKLPFVSMGSFEIEQPEVGEVYILVEGQGRIPEGKIQVNFLVRENAPPKDEWPAPPEPPPEDPKAKKKAKPKKGEEEPEEPAKPDLFGFAQLAADPVHRFVWSGPVEPNDHRRVLREQLTVPEELRTAIRVTTSRKGARLKLCIQCQHPPLEGTGSHGYGTRRGWLDRLQTLRVCEGSNEVRTDHVVLCPGVTYILHVQSEAPLWEARPNAWEAGDADWTLEFFTNGPQPQLGPDVVNEELKELLRTQWEQDREGRASRAATLRQGFLQKTGRLEASASAGLLGQVEVERRESKEAKDKGKLSKQEQEAEAQRQAQEEEERKKRLLREEHQAWVVKLVARSHPNAHVRPDRRDFLRRTVVDPPSLPMCDPYTILPLSEETRSYRHEERVETLEGWRARAEEVKREAAQSLDTFHQRVEGLADWRTAADVAVETGARTGVKDHLDDRARSRRALLRGLLDPQAKPKEIDVLLKKARKFEVQLWDPHLVHMAVRADRLSTLLAQIAQFVDELEDQAKEEPDQPLEMLASPEHQAALAELLHQANLCQRDLKEGAKHLDTSQQPVAQDGELATASGQRASLVEVLGSGYGHEEIDKARQFLAI